MACPNCKSDQSSVRYEFGAERILRCAACDLLFIHPWPSEAQLRAVYGENYFQNASFLSATSDALFGYSDYIAERFNKQIQYAKIARQIFSLAPHDGPRPRLLEVGCAFGYFLDVAFEEGFEVHGLEFNPHAVARLREKYAFPIHTGALETTSFDPGSFDAVALFDVIEHLRDPFTGLDQVHHALAPNGALVLSTLDAESWVSRMLGKRLEDFRRTREHLIFFGRRTMTRILTEHGFEVLSIRSIGHTFNLTFLLARLELYNRPFFGTLRRIIERVGLGGLQIYLNPRTKMIVFARRK